MASSDVSPRSSANPAVWALILIGLALLFRLWGATAIGFGTGEAYYASSARELHLSYFDQPPLSLWIIWATMKLTGSEAVWLLRLPFVLMFVVTSFLVYRLGEKVHSGWAGFYAVLILNVSAIFTLSVGSWLQPDAPMMLFWAATCLVLVDIFVGQGGERPWRNWLLAGLWLGLTLLSKYHGAFIGLGAAIFMLANANARRWFAHPAPYVAALLALVIFLPVPIWNAQNHWVSFAFQGGRALAEESWNWARLIRMIVGQLLYIVPWLALPAIWVGLHAIFAGPRAQYPQGSVPGAAALLAYIGVPPVIFFTLVALWSDTQFHFHWQAPGYMSLFIILAASTTVIARRHAWLIRTWLGATAAITVLLIGALLSHAATGWARQAFPGQWEDPTVPQMAWTEVGEALNRLNAFATPDTFVGGLNWIECGYLDAQTAGRAPLPCIGEDPRNIAFNVDLADLAGRSGYFVTRTTDPQSSIAYLAQLFDSVSLVETVDIKRNGLVEIPDLQILSATNFHFDGSVPDVSGRSVSLLELPRTAITRVEGQVTGSGPVDLWLDGVQVASFTANGPTAFAFDAPGRWDVGARNSTLEITGPEDVEFTAVSVTRQ
ncbi:glycosyltransferase family 39 protein [Devosia yakushimensis]|nr:glycosyltransferase family 39 protein [Devosia yakushimensis]